MQYCSTLISIINYNVLLLQIPGNEMAVFYLVEDSSTLISFLIGKKEPILIKKKKRHELEACWCYYQHH